MNPNLKAKLITGALSLAYCVVPMVQDKTFSSFSERFNNHCFFFLSGGVYGFMQLIYTNRPGVYAVQLVLWLFLWWISYLAVRLFTRGEGSTTP